MVDVEIIAQLIDALGGSVGKPGSGQLTMRTADPHVLSVEEIEYFAGGAASRSSSAARCWRGVARSSSPTSAGARSARAQSTSTSTRCAGSAPTSVRVYEERFGYTHALNEMGAQIQLYREYLGARACRFGSRDHLHSAVVVGPTKLHGADIRIPDLRAGMSYVIAALVAEGDSTISNIELIRRGYENFEGKLRDLGVCLLDDE